MIDEFGRKHYAKGEKEFYDNAFTNPTTKQPYNVPEGIRTAAEHICGSYGIRGICDPMYIANVIAHYTGMGDGKSHFSKVVTIDTI